MLSAKRLLGATVFLTLISFMLPAQAFNRSDLNRLLETGQCRRCDLRDADLERVNLSRADLRNANLEGANLSITNLSSANLQDANLKRANLRQASLRSANLEEANLERANLQNADLRDANLEDANLERANLQDADLRNANLEDARLRNANLRNADLRDADLDDADLRDANIAGTLLDQNRNRQTRDDWERDRENRDQRTRSSDPLYDSWRNTDPRHNRQTGNQGMNSTDITRVEFYSRNNNPVRILLRSDEGERTLSFGGNLTQTILSLPRRRYELRFQNSDGRTWRSGTLDLRNSRTNQIRIFFDNNRNAVEVQNDPRAWNAN
mgnify:CR=1 FL=1